MALRSAATIVIADRRKAIHENTRHYFRVTNITPELDSKRIEYHHRKVGTHSVQRDGRSCCSDTDGTSTVFRMALHNTEQVRRHSRFAPL